MSTERTSIYPFFPPFRAPLVGPVSPYRPLPRPGRLRQEIEPRYPGASPRPMISGAAGSVLDLYA